MLYLHLPTIRDSNTHLTYYTLIIYDKKSVIRTETTFLLKSDKEKLHFEHRRERHTYMPIHLICSILEQSIRLGNAPYVIHNTKEIASGDLLDISIGVSPLLHFLKYRRHSGNIFETFRGHVDAVKI